MLQEVAQHISDTFDKYASEGKDLPFSTLSVTYIEAVVRVVLGSTAVLSRKNENALDEPEIQHVMQSVILRVSHNLVDGIMLLRNGPQTRIITGE